MNSTNVKKKMREQKGITLVALVVTIIVLLILAGISLYALTGENGIINRSSDSARKYQNSSLNEQEQLKNVEDWIDGNYGNGGGPSGGTDGNWDGTVNSPKTTLDMIPVKWNGNNWVVCSKDDPDWYSYDGSSNKWANVILSDGTFTVSTVTVGQVLAESDLGSMFVWIPRYAYKISNYHSSTAGSIDIKFLKGITDEAGDGTTINTSGYSSTGTNTSNSYFTHPTFQNGSSTGYQNGEWDMELSGIWVAKFEASASNSSGYVATTSAAIGNVTTLTVKIIPNVSSWRYIETGTSYTNCLNMYSNGNSHMMKNSEWGAVAYLTQSKYGRNGVKLYINNSNTCVTGNSGGSTSAASTAGVTNAYDTVNGVLASTTGNIYGIYDLSGGAFEHTPAYVTNGKPALATYGSSYAYTTAEENPTTRSTKYATAYGYDIVSGGSAHNYLKNSERYGDAIYETSINNGEDSNIASYFDGDSFFPYAMYTFIDTPFFGRGGDFNGGEKSNIFIYSTSDSASGISSFRPCLAF